MSLSQVAGPSTPNIFGILICLCLRPLTWNDQIRLGNTWAVACFRGQPPPRPVGQSRHYPIFWYLLLMRTSLTKNDQSWHGNT